MTENKQNPPSSDPTIEAARRVNGLRITERGKTVATVAGSAALIGLAGLGLNAMEGGPSHPPEHSEIDPSIASITTSPDATFRYSPHVGDSDIDDNFVLHPGEAITIDAVKDMLVTNDTPNGTWYGVPVENLREVVPDLNDRGDKDGILWVNEQGVLEVNRTEKAEE